MAPSRLPRVGISSCLLGEYVRYDGGHRKQLDLLQAFKGLVEWVPTCPEVEIGLGVPRETIQIESHKGYLRLMTSETRRDLTDLMRSWAAERVLALTKLQICGYVFKARSPSCGINSAAINALDAKAWGVFANEVASHMPLLPLAEEGELETDAGRQQFLDRIRAYSPTDR